MSVASGLVARRTSPALGKNCYIALMTMRSHTLARGPGWCVLDLLCNAGPRDRPFEEQHETVCIAAVTHGTFQYRSTEGRALLVPGGLLLGNHGRCFECGHEHGTGDRCISFHFAPEYWEAVIRAVPGARTATFPVPCLPPSPPLIPLVATVEAACRDRSSVELEELALRLAGVVTAVLAGTDRGVRPPSRRDERRISDAVRRIEAEAHEPLEEPLSLTTLAREVAISPYHFLRTFRQVVGMTPHQFVLRTRLHRAAVRLRRPEESISAIAFDAGFNDLSTFNRRFRRIIGASPSAYRTRRWPHSRKSFEPRNDALPRNPDQVEGRLPRVSRRHS
jgi:AraC family transcriptional regulator